MVIGLPPGERINKILYAHPQLIKAYMQSISILVALVINNTGMVKHIFLSSIYADQLNV